MNLLRVALGTGVCALAVLLGGCRQTSTGGPAVVRGKAPDYATVAAAYNARLAPLTKLVATTTVQVRFKNNEGKEESVQFEGHFNFMRPWRVMMSFEKLGDTYAILGSNDTRYWWMEKDKKWQAVVGSHAKVNPQRIAELGLPVHPLDLIELLGITELPSSVPAVGAGEFAEVEWSEDGRWLVATVPGRPSRRRLWLDAVNYEPSRVELIDKDGKAAASASLDHYEAVQIAGMSSPPRIATVVNALTQGESVRVRLTLNSPEVSARYPKEEAFEFEGLVKRYKVGEVRLLDQGGQVIPGP